MKTGSRNKAPKNKGPLSGEKKPTETTPSISSISPEYPRYRDTIIIFSVIVIVLILFVGGYFLFKGTGISFKKFTRNPARYVTNLIIGPEIYDVCRSFLRENEKQFPELGRITELSLVKTEMRSVRGTKSARVTLKVKGSRGTQRVHFRLRKQQRKWTIVSVALETPEGEYVILYPETKTRT